MSKVSIDIGGEFFRENRETSSYYADKTGLIEELLSGKPPKVSLITRPRRFGKTLMMTMLRDFFDITQDSKAIFDGLAISKNKELCDKWMNQYPVIFITLKEIDAENFSQAVEQVRTLVREVAVLYDYLLESDKVNMSDKRILQEFLDSKSSRSELEAFLSTLCRALYAHWGKKAIILIDEYDVPLAKAQGKGYYPEMVAFVRNIMGQGLKTNDYLKFGILTGCLRVSDESFFTGLNNFKCYGISDVLYADKFGFTPGEVEDLLAQAGFSEKINGIKECYEGYRFGDDTEIYCPWDILQYVDDLQVNPDARLKLYWGDTSRNEVVSVIVEHGEREDVRIKLDTLMRGGCIPVRITENLTHDLLYENAENIWTVLYYSGYLTKAGPEQMKKSIKPGEESGKGETFLAIPNKEVLEIFADVISEWFRKEVRKADRSELFKALQADDAGALAELLCRQLNDTICWYDVRDDFYHDFVRYLFSLSNWDVESNKGLRNKPNLIFRDKKNKRAAIIEIKRCKSQRGLPGNAVKAINQIKRNRYAASLLKNEDLKISLWGMAFFKKTCEIRVEEVVRQS